MIGKIHVLTLVVIAGLLAAVLPATTPAAAQAAATETGYQANAFGSRITIGSFLRQGPSALSMLGCTSHAGITRTNSAAQIGVPPQLSTGMISTSAASEATSNGPLATSSATTQQVSALRGLVTATLVEAVSSTTQNGPGGGFSTSAAGTQFAGLVVAGTPISDTPAPNTKISLPGVGYVILNQQVSQVTAARADLKVTAIHVYVTRHNHITPVGTQVIVARATSGLGGPVNGLLDGLAYAARASLSVQVIAEQQFPQLLPCLGTNGETRTRSGTSLSIPGILTSGPATDTATGMTTATTSSAAMTSTVQDLNLLGGLVTATLVKADISATGNAPALADNSTFTGLIVAGQPGIGSDVKPNTLVELTGLGGLWLHREIETKHKITVIMLQLIVTVPNNPEGLKVDTKINVGYAQATIR